MHKAKLRTCSTLVRLLHIASTLHLLISVEFREEAFQLKNDLNCMLAKGDIKLNKRATNFEKEVERQKALNILGLD